MTPRRWLVVVSLFLASVLSCCFPPNVVVRIYYGNWPIGDPNKYKYGPGMTQEQIRSVLGSPHVRDRYEDGSERWCYYCDAFGMNIVSILFDRDGIVVAEWW